MKRPSSFSTHIKRHANSWESNGTNAQRFFNFDSPEREIRGKTHIQTNKKEKTFFLLLIVTDGNNNLQLRKEWVRSGPVTLERGSTHRAGQLLLLLFAILLLRRFRASSVHMQLTVNFLDEDELLPSIIRWPASTHTHRRWGQKKGAMTGQIHARLVAHTSLCNPSRHSEGRNRREKKQQQEKKKKRRRSESQSSAIQRTVTFPFFH
jgi:hypothetical protein